MSLPIGVNSNEYLEHLREFRESALTESHFLGKRKSIGGFVFGIAQARWVNEDGGTAHLIEQGLRYRSTLITGYMPTTLRLSYRPGEVGLEIVSFRMDIDDSGYIEIFRNLITNGSFGEVLSAELHKRADRKHKLSEPTDEQRELLYREMQRGASGLYAEKEAII